MLNQALLRRRVMTSSSLLTKNSTGIIYSTASLVSFPSSSSSSASSLYQRYMASYTKVLMPALSPTMTAGKIAKWSKKEGDGLKSGDVLAEIETDKATMDFQFQDDDLFLAKILVPEGTEDVQVGSVVALVVENKADIPEVQSTYQSTLGSTPAPAPPAPAKPVAAAPAPAPAPPKPVVAAPVVAAPVPAPTVTPAAKPVVSSTPVPASTPSTDSNGAAYLAFENWGMNLSRGGLGTLIAKQQKTYTDIFGYSGYDHLPVPEEDTPKGGKGGASKDDKKSKK